MATSDDCGDTLGDGDESKMATSYEISFLHSECERLQIKGAGDGGTLSISGDEVIILRCSFRLVG
ncbi:hypothetical protein F2Q70_00005063 [Brassica cretica]|uniref:Uncharacterized protein n=1 Tax=Brassica cretica TaxID=69181 RepID=A0A8S9IXK7_BRACR|nr:hypothetical protein F2Q70_00005063 [Brassica cretica]